MDKSASHKMYFVAIVCDQGIEDKIIQFKHFMRDRYGCVTSLRSPAHITLVPPFWLEEKVEPILISRLLSFKGYIDKLQIDLDGFDHFGKRVLFVKVNTIPQLEELRDLVTNHFIATVGNVIKKEERLFHPHITIANRDLKPNDFIKAWEYFSKKQFKDSFKTNTISLLKLSPGKWNVIAQHSWSN